MRRTPALIVGGGPAGAAAAITLARAGLPHLLLERQRETGDTLCGGFLSWRTLERVATLGIDADRLNARRVTQVRLVSRTDASTAALPRPALAVSRARLDTLLLDRAIAAGAAVEQGVAVRTIDGGTARLSDAAEICVEALFLASGKHDVRGAARPAPNGKGDPALGLRVRLAAAPGLGRLIGEAIELHLVRGGYAGLVLQEDGSANLCMAIRRSRLHEAGDPERLLAALGAEAPRLGERLAYRGSGAPIDAVANVPYGWRQRSGIAGLFRLGDQAAVIPSLAGEGMGIALASGIASAEAYRRDGPSASAAWQAAFARSIAGPLAAAGALRRVAERPLLARAAPWLPGGALRLLAHLTRIP